MRTSVDSRVSTVVQSLSRTILYYSLPLHIHTHSQGCLNTYSRAGKLFPGPHLYGGAALLVLWTLAVATIPAMQQKKGNDGGELARLVHIGANVGSLALLTYQVTSGVPILLKVVELTSWP